MHYNKVLLKCDQKTHHWLSTMSLLLTPPLYQSSVRPLKILSSPLTAACSCHVNSETYIISVLLYGGLRGRPVPGSSRPYKIPLFEICIVQPHPLVAMDDGRGPSFPLPPGVIPSHSRTDMVELMSTSTDDRQGVLREVNNYFLILHVAMLSTTKYLLH